jgi:predicted nucleotidyltransferase component of viral defense system
MSSFKEHEIFEMEVLERLKSNRFLESLVFGGGTMLRLCHELPRYSVVLDFWKLKEFDDSSLLENLKTALGKSYEITDAQLKRNTILLELRSARFPRRLKIEIRRRLRDWEYENVIAFSPFGTAQVQVKAHTLNQTMQNKIEALSTRGAIRDAFDMEFLLRKGVPLPKLTKEEIDHLQKQLDKFKPRDFKVTLGSLLEAEWRNYYAENGFKFLSEKLRAQTLL